MQDPGLFPERRTTKPQLPDQEQPQLQCPRCDSTNTKFCYYNNYNLSQPRHFCKSCRRYWTKGGALRNVPVGGGSRKNSKKSSASKPKNYVSSTTSTAAATASSPCSSSSSSFLKAEQDISAGIYGQATDYDHRLLDITGTFSSLLASNGHFGSLCEPMSSRTGKAQRGVAAPENGWGLPEYSTGTAHGASDDNGEALLLDPACWVGGNWPDLAMYAPRSNFQ
ncbi:unnamed protein product [Victoria cruziana]